MADSYNFYHFKVDTPENFSPIIINPDDKNTWLPQMVFCDTIEEMYAVMSEKPRIITAACLNPQIPRSAERYARWLARQHPLYKVLWEEDGNWSNWLEGLQAKLETLPPPPKGASAKALLSFFKALREIDNHNYFKVAGFTAGKERFIDGGVFHHDSGSNVFLYDFFHNNTWHLPHHLNETTAKHSDIRVFPAGAATLHRGNHGARGFIRNSKSIHAAPVSKALRATFTLFTTRP